MSSARDVSSLIFWAARVVDYTRWSTLDSTDCQSISLVDDLSSLTHTSQGWCLHRVLSRRSFSMRVGFCFVFLVCVCVVVFCVCVVGCGVVVVFGGVFWGEGSVLLFC